MQCLHRVPVRFALACLAFAFISPNASPHTAAQQTSGAAGQAASSPRPNADAVILAVAVLEQRNTFVEGLEKSHFTVFDNKAPQEISFFRGLGDEPASVGIVFDASRSMKGGKFKELGPALARFLQKAHPENDYFLIGFNDSPQLLVDWTRDGGREVASRITSLKPQRDTALYDACYLAVEKIMRASRPRRVLLLISDGQDNMSRFSSKDVTRLLKESDVTLYSVGLLGGDDPGSSLGMEGQSVLEKLSAVSGGAVYFPNSLKELDKVFERIAYELRHQYQLAFVPTDASRDGKWHKIKVEVRLPKGAAPPGLKIWRVRTREGYLAAKSPR
jgi:Ca-activated chloride channel homolog